MSEPSDPTNALVIAVNSQLSDKHFRKSLREMHDAGYPLVKMVEVLGLEEDMSPAMLELLANLSPQVVDGIRRATLDMLDREEQTLPVSWGLTEAEFDRGVPVDVEIVETERGRVIRVRPDGRVGR